MPEESQAIVLTDQERKNYVECLSSHAAKGDVLACGMLLMLESIDMLGMMISDFISEDEEEDEDEE